MIWMSVILGLVILLMIMVLVTPIYLTVDTNKSNYMAGIKGVVQVAFEPEDFTGTLLLPFLRLKFRRKLQFPAKKEGSAKVRKKSGERRSLNLETFTLIARLWSTFNCKRLWINVDTGDFSTNAQLIPILQLLSAGNVRLTINFQGLVSLELSIENRLIRCVGPLWRYALAKK